MSSADVFGPEGQADEVLDLENVQSDFALIPIGAYPCIVEDAKQKRGMESGEKFVAWRFKIVSGDFAGRILFHNTSLQPQAMFAIKRVLAALGEDVKTDKYRLNLPSLIGKQCLVTTSHQNYRGQVREKVESVQTYDAKAVSPF